MISMNRTLFDQTAVCGEHPVLVAYCAPWCRYCQHLTPVLQRLAQQYAPGITFGTIDIDQEPQLASDEQIEVVPTLVLYRAGSVLGSIVVPECGRQIEGFLREALEI